MSDLPQPGANEELTTAATMTRPQAVTLVEKLLKEAAPLASRFRARGLVNESFVYGDQFPEDRSQDRNVSDPGGLNASLVPSIPVNLTTPLLSTWESLMTKDRPTGVAVAGTDRPEDVYDARITQAVIEYEQADLKSAEVIHDTVHLAGLHGTAGIKITYAPDEDRIVWAPTSIYNFLVAPSATSEDDSPYLIFQDWNMSKSDAEDLFEQAGINREPNEKPHSSPGTPERKGVAHVELWLRPSRDYPHGLYVCVVDNEAIEIEDYPFTIPSEDGDPTRADYPFPLVTMKVRKVRSCPYGNTNLTDVIPLQRGYNESVNKIQRLLRQVTNLHLILPQSLQEGFDPATSTMIGFPDALAESARAIGYTQAGEISPTLFQQRDFFEKSMQKVMGLNDITASSDNPRLSGTAIENMVALDAQRNADCTRSMQSMVIKAWELTLELIGHFYQRPRIASFTNANSSDVVQFVAEDVRGKNIKIQLGSEVDTLQPAKEQVSVDREQKGLATAADVARIQNTPAYAMSKAAAEQIVQAIAAGAPPPIDGLQGIDPDVLADVIRKAQAAALAQGDRGLWVRLEQFLRSASSMGPAQASAAPVAPGPQPPPSAPQPGP